MNSIVYKNHGVIRWACALFDTQVELNINSLGFVELFLLVGQDAIATSKDIAIARAASPWIKKFYENDPDTTVVYDVDSYFPFLHNIHLEIMSPFTSDDWDTVASCLQVYDLDGYVKNKLWEEE